MALGADWGDPYFYSEYVEWFLKPVLKDKNLATVAMEKPL
jgi:hypothetical protein